MDVWREGRTRRRYALEEVAQYKDLESALRDPLIQALPRALKTDVENMKTPGPIRAWLHARGTWLSDALRKSVSPGHGHVVVFGGGFNGAILRLPQGLLGSGVIHVCDTAEVIEAQTVRVQNLPWEPPARMSFAKLSSVGFQEALRTCVGALMQSPQGLPVTCLLYSPALLWDDEVRAWIEALCAQLQRPVQVAWDWLGPDVRTLPESVQDMLCGAFGRPEPWSDVATDLWLRALGAQSVDTTPLLSWRGVPVGFGTWFAWQPNESI